MDTKKKIADRIKQVIGEGSVSAFARKAGIYESLLRQYVAGSMPGADKLVAIARAAHVNLEWLATGEGPMDAPPRPTLKVRESAADYHGVETGAPAGYVVAAQPRVIDRSGEKDTLVGGQALDYLAFKADWVRTELGADPERLALVRAVGDAMAPTLSAGDLLLLDYSFDRIKQDAIYAIAVDGALQIKRIQRLLDGALLIKSDNPVYQEQHVMAEHAGEVPVVGRVVWTGKRR
ncbi:MAG TPA: hypothetical protein DEP05_09205 [Betaproteobacteria bacterium]|nr:hypothetical protein [Betaproteobacteria bacterium]